jgi:signal peptidase I
MVKALMPILIKIFKNRYFKLLIISAVYALWVLWLQSYWLLLGLIIIADVNLTHYVNWRFWRKRLPAGIKHKWPTELLDAVIWAGLIAVFIRIFLFEAYSIPTSSMEKTLLVGDYILVSKLKYGPRFPITPLTIPFTHNALPFLKTRNSFVNSIQRPYRRLRGISEIKHFDVVVFNYPEGDSVIREFPEKSYYTMTRQYGSKDIREKYHILYRAADKRDNYVKRVIGLPGDTVKIQHGVASINTISEKLPDGLQYNYSVKIINETDTSLFERLDISAYDIKDNGFNSIYTIPLTNTQYHTIIDSGFFKAIVRDENIDATETNSQIFPFDKKFKWTEDNFGPLVIPGDGSTVNLTIENLPLYKRIITAYEGNDLKASDTSIYINGKLATNYTFKMNYYFMLGDNRQNSNDSRYWGFVPENHIIGCARLVWLSIDKNKKFPDNIRWNKMFKFIH